MHAMVVNSTEIGTIVPVFRQGGSMDAQELGRFAKEQRREAGLSQQDVALLADVSERFVRAFESGKGSVHLDKAIAVLSVVGFDLEPQLHNGQFNARLDPWTLTQARGEAS